MEPKFQEFSVKNESGSLPLVQKYIDKKCTWFSESGNIVEVANYLVGMLHGENVVYKKDGSIKSYDFYEYGKRIARKTF
ncbi:TPA: hypothetical protein ACMDT9_002179 [Vibrio parahaemolyticus]